MVFQWFIDRLIKASGAEELSEAMARLVGELGLAKFAYLDFRRPGDHLPVYLTTYPTEWVYRYMSRRYQNIDPVVSMARRSILPFLWDDQISGTNASREQRRFFGEAAEFGIRCGLAIPVHDNRTGIAMVSFVSDDKPEEMKRSISAHRDMLHLASIYFHVHARQTLQSAETPENPSLDPEEVACLQWIVRGRDSSNIGETLGISQHAVGRHLKSAKRKLHAATLSHAVATALYHRLIEF